MYDSTLGLRVIKKHDLQVEHGREADAHADRVDHAQAHARGHAQDYYYHQEHHLHAGFGFRRVWKIGYMGSERG